MYLTYAEYKEYGGTVTEPAFNSLIYEAQVKVDYYTFNRLINDTVISEKIKRCIVKIIELLNTYDEYQKVVTDVNSPIISSQSNDGVSVSYGGYLGNTSPQDLEVVAKKLDTDILTTIKQYLSNERNQKGEVLLYRGVYR